MTKSRVDRRTFVRTVGAGGAAGIAGCLGEEDDYEGEAAGNGNGNGDDGELVEDVDADDYEVELQVTANSEVAGNADDVRELLWDAGLSEDIFPHLVEVGDVTDDMEAEYRSWLSAGRETPDVLVVDSGWTIPFIIRDQLVNLEEELSGDVLDEIHSEYFEMSVESAVDPDNGDLYAVPLYPDFPTIQYRKDLIEEATDHDTDAWATDPLSWQEFSEVISETLEYHDDIDTGYSWQAPAAEQLSCCVFNEMLTSWGGAYFGGPDNLYGPVGDRPVTVDEEPVIDSLRMGRTFIRGEDDEHALEGYHDISPDAVVQWDIDPSMAEFQDGNAIALRNWPYSIAINGSEDVHGEDMGVMPMPYGVEPEEADYEGTGGSVAALGGWHWAVNPHTEKRDAAIEFVETIVDEEFMLGLFELVGFIPPKPSVVNSSEAEDLEVVGRYVDTLRYAGEHAMPRPVTVLWPEQSNRIETAANAVLNDQASPEEEMANLKEELEALEEEGAE